MIQNDFPPPRVLAERRLKGLANHTAIAPQAWRGKVSTRLRKRRASERSSAAGVNPPLGAHPPSATAFLRRQASWPAALRPRNERRTAATPAIPAKPSSIIAQVAGSGAAGGSSTGPPAKESVSLTLPKYPHPKPFVKLE